jgi:hypothetical protein
VNRSASAGSVRLILLCLAFLFLAAAGWIRFALSIADWDTLRQAGVGPGVWYLAGSGLAWGAGGVGCALALWLGGRAGRQVGLWGVFLFLATYWADRLFFSQSAPAQANWAFALVLSAFLAFMAFFLLYSLKPAYQPETSWKTRDESDSSRN